MFTLLFWKDAAERVVWTFAQSLLGFFIATGFTPLTADWSSILVTALFAGVVCLLKVIVTAEALKGVPTVSPGSTAIDSRGYTAK